MTQTSGKIVIFGATSAIAIEAAKIWAVRGAKLFLVGRSLEKLDAVAKDLRARGALHVDVRAVDLNDIASHPQLVDDADRVLQDADTVLVAHGTLGNQEECQKSFKAAELELKTNFLSAASILTEFANRLEKRGSGTLVVISSVAGDRGRQSNYVYGAAKGALTILLQGLRNRLFKSGVHVVTIKPGFVDTPMTKEFKKGLLFVGPEVIGRGIVKSIDSKINVVYLPWFWQFIMLIIRHIPETIFKRLKL